MSRIDSPRPSERTRLKAATPGPGPSARPGGDGRLVEPGRVVAEQPHARQRLGLGDLGQRAEVGPAVDQDRVDLPLLPAEPAERPERRHRGADRLRLAAGRQVERPPHQRDGSGAAISTARPCAVAEDHADERLRPPRRPEPPRRVAEQRAGRRLGHARLDPGRLQRREDARQVLLPARHDARQRALAGAEPDHVDDHVVDVQVGRLEDLVEQDLGRRLAVVGLDRPGREEDPQGRQADRHAGLGQLLLREPPRQQPADGRGQPVVAERLAVAGDLDPPQRGRRHLADGHLAVADRQPDVLPQGQPTEQGTHGLPPRHTITGKGRAADSDRPPLDVLDRQVRSSQPIRCCSSCRSCPSG